MQVRLTGIAGTAHTRQHLTSPHEVACLDTHAPRLKMHIVRKLPSAEINGDRISGHRVERDRYSGVERLAVPGDVIGKAVFRRDYTAIRDGQHGLSIRVVRSHVARVAEKRGTIFNLFPIDGVAP